jgi:hypothetical protein
MYNKITSASKAAGIIVNNDNMHVKMNPAEQHDLQLAFDIADMLKKHNREKTSTILLKVYKLLLTTN